MPILDANVILRYLLRDLPDKAEEAKAAVMAGASTTAEVLAEVVYVLSGVYKADRVTIATALEAFIQEVEVPHKTALRYAFQLYRARKLDFVDCVLAGYHHSDIKPGMWVLFQGEKWNISTLGEYQFKRTYLGLKATLSKGVTG